MKPANLRPFFVIALGALLLAPPAFSQETVTIPKSRFEELVRKEKELDSLRGELSATKTESVRLRKEKEEAVAKVAAAMAAAPAEPAITHVSPPMATLPQLAKGETVDAMDLANHYRTDAAAADARYRTKVFRVKGEIVGFEKPMFTRNYNVLLRAADRQMRILCTVAPPEKFSAVFPAQGGTVLMGAYSSGTRVPLAKLNDTVVIEGRCGGLDGQIVKLNGCTLLASP